MGIKFNWEFNVGTILTIITFAVGVVGLYISISETLTRHDMRLSVIERRVDPSPAIQDHESRLRAIETLAVNARAERLAFQNDVMGLLIGIREDIAALKATDGRGGQ